MFIISEEGRRCRWINRGLGGETVEGVGVMKDGDLKLEKIEVSLTLGGDVIHLRFVSLTDVVRLCQFG